MIESYLVRFVLNDILTNQRCYSHTTSDVKVRLYSLNITLDLPCLTYPSPVSNTTKTIGPSRTHRLQTVRRDVSYQGQFTAGITKRTAGKIGMSTPVVMPILKIKSKQKLCFVSHVWRNHSCVALREWWAVSRCEFPATADCIITFSNNMIFQWLITDYSIWTCNKAPRMRWQISGSRINV